MNPASSAKFFTLDIVASAKMANEIPRDLRELFGAPVGQAVWMTCHSEYSRVLNGETFFQRLRLRPWPKGKRAKSTALRHGR